MNSVLQVFQTSLERTHLKWLDGAGWRYMERTTLSIVSEEGCLKNITRVADQSVIRYANVAATRERVGFVEETENREWREMG